MIHSRADQLSWNYSPALSGYVVNRVEWEIAPAFQWPQPRGQTGWRGGEVIWELVWNISDIDFCLTDLWVKENTVFSTNLSLTLSENGIRLLNNAYFSKWWCWETTDLNCLPWPGKIITTCIGYLTTGVPDKKHRTNKLPPAGRIQERQKGRGRHQPVICPANGPETFALESVCWERHRLPERTLNQTESGTSTTGKLSPHSRKTQTASHETQQLCWAPFCFSPPGSPFPIKSFALSVHVSLWAVHFQVSNKSPLSGPGRRTPSGSSIYIFKFLLNSFIFYAVSSIWWYYGI